MQFSAVIPVYNGAEKIAATIRGMLDQVSVQSGKDSVEIIVVDGASSDGTADVARAFGPDQVSVISEPDIGMYDALAKGLSRARGEVTCYLPAGETYDPHAFSVVSEVMSENPQIKWLTGRGTSRNERGQITSSRVPHPYHRNLFRCGAYGDPLWALQQESTFWRTELHSDLDMDRLRCLKLAGDFFLWWSFAERHELYVVNAILSAFTFEEGQLSRRNPGAYEAELRSIARAPTLRERWQIARSKRPQRRIIPRVNSARLLSWSHEEHRWRLARD
ncbi:MAG: glycosyltransferase [Pseudomonadota bacterium]